MGNVLDGTLLGGLHTALNEYQKAKPVINSHNVLDPFAIVVGFLQSEVENLCIDCKDLEERRALENRYKQLNEAWEAYQGARTL